MPRSLLPNFLLPSFLLPFLLLSTTTAQRIANELSFGHNARLSPSEGGTIPGWQGSSTNHNLQILSDRVILTPPIPGNARGALWTEKAIDSETWIADVEFRASGQETGGGSNLNFWFAKDKTPIFTDNVYTVGNFDGLVITIDQYGGTGGMIRGFLNDGTQNFKSHSSLESLAFGHCDYAYRNLGRPSKLKVTSLDGLKVSIDDKECFSSNKISLPSGYFFGVTAATSEHPDSFEVGKFVVTSSIPHTHEHVAKGGAPPIPKPNPNVNNQKTPHTHLDRFPGAPEAVPDKPAEEIRSQVDQFADLHNRLQTLSHQVAMIFSELGEIADRIPEPGDPHTTPATEVTVTALETKIDTLNRRLTNMETSIENTRKGYENIERVVEYTRKGFDNIEKIMESTRKEMEGRDYQLHFHNLNQALDTMTASAPRMGMFVFIVLGVQVSLAASYVVYKRRRAGMPKKYL